MTMLKFTPKTYNLSLDCNFAQCSCYELYRAIYANQQFASWASAKSHSRLRSLLPLLIRCACYWIAPRLHGGPWGLQYRFARCLRSSSRLMFTPGAYAIRLEINIKNKQEVKYDTNLDSWSTRHNIWDCKI